MKVDPKQPEAVHFAFWRRARGYDGKEQAPLKRTDGRANVLLMAGLQGAGKTTAVAKLVTEPKNKTMQKNSARSRQFLTCSN